MSYLSRLYNHRNAQSVEGKEQPFFSKKHDGPDVHNKTPFFQGGHPPIQRLSTEDESHMPSTNDGRMALDKYIQEKPMDNGKQEEQPVQRAAQPGKEEERPVQKAAMPGKEEEQPAIQKMELPDKKKEETPVIQKIELPDKKKEDAPPVQKMSAEPEKEKLQKKGNAAPAASSKVETGIKSTAGKGRRLPRTTAQEMSNSFGVDLSNVNIHDGSEAAQLNEALHARAFTHGNDIYFNNGQFNPEQADGRHLLAHELTHVVQQDRQGMLQKKDGPDKKGPAKEDNDLEKKYAGLIQKGDKDWSPAERQILLSALGRMSKEEANVLRNYQFIRWTSKYERMKIDKDYVDPGVTECGLHEMKLEKGLYRISMYDECFSDPEARPGTDQIAGIDKGEFKMLHEMGHAMQNADLRNKYETYAKKKDTASGDAMTNAKGLPLKDTKKLLQGHDPLTDYSKTNDAEAFADAFAVYKADPAGLKKSNGKLYTYFNSGAYLHPGEKK